MRKHLKGGDADISGEHISESSQILLVKHRDELLL